MSLQSLLDHAAIEPAAPWMLHHLSADSWQRLAAEQSIEFVGLWTDKERAFAIFTAHERVIFAATALVDGAYPALSPIRPAAAWFERFARDRMGHVANGMTDSRPAFAHGSAWPSFLPATGEGIHQINVGPVHAAIIEPAHFRFSVQGEALVRLEARLGYTHRGVLGLIEGKSPRIASRFAARISGDSTVAHSMAFAHAAEAAMNSKPPLRAVLLRAIMGELERLAHHTGDLAGIAGDVGFGFLEARFGFHREAILAACLDAFGHRLMMDLVIPGGLAGDIKSAGLAAIETCLAALTREMPSLARVFDNYAGLQDRLVGTGIAPRDLVAIYAPGGVVGRAAGRAMDARLQPGYPPYDQAEVRIALQPQGDVAARARVRLDEISESIRLIRSWAESLPDGLISVPLPAETGVGLGVAEGFRGAVWHYLRIESGQIQDCFVVDPSTLHWPLIEAAMVGNIVADFPLINKSFNPSYAGVDL
jgi:Ni,Fe-hydrogenase III large subunit